MAAFDPRREGDGFQQESVPLCAPVLIGPLSDLSDETGNRL